MGSESKRQQKFARLLQKDLGEMFQREMDTLLPGVMVTVTSVHVSPDLGAAKIYLSFFNAKDTKEAINTIKVHTADIRYKLGKRIKNQVRVIPELDFFIDDTNEYAEHMDKLFDEIHKEDKKTN